MARKKKLKKALSKKSKENITAFDKWMENILFYLVIASVVLIPLLFDTVTYDPFDLVKNVAFRIIVSLMVLILVVWMSFSKNFKFLLHPSFYFVLLFLVVAFIATLTSVEFWVSVWGKYRRYEGLVAFITYGLFLFTAVNAFRDKRKIEIATKIAVITGAVISIYGLAQYLGHDFLRWGPLPFEQRRAFATLGNPALLAGYLVTVLPLGLGLTIFSRKTYELIYSSISTLLIFICLIATFNRTSWLAALLSLICMAVAIVYLWRKGALDKETISNLIILGIAIVVFFVGIAVQSTVSKSPITVVERVKEITVFTGSFQHRLEIWGAGFRMVADEPLFGLGPDTFRSTSRIYQGPGYGKIAPDIVADNAHNYELQIASGTGMLGFLFFASFVMYVFFLGTRILFIKSLEGRKKAHYSSTKEVASIGVNLGLFISFLAYLFQLLTSVSIIGSTVMWWFVFAGIISQSDRLRALNINFSGKSFAKWVSIVLAITLFLVTSIIHGRLLYADMLYFKGKQWANRPSFVASGEDYIRRAITLDPWRWEYPVEIARGYYQQYLQTKNENSLDKALRYTLFARQIDSHEADIRALLIQIYLLKGRTNPQYHEKAEEVAREMTEDMPYHYVSHLSLGSAHFYQGEYQQAIEQFERAVSLNPRSAISYLYMAQSYSNMGDRDMANRLYQKAIEIDPSMAQRFQKSEEPGKSK